MRLRWHEQKPDYEKTDTIKDVEVDKIFMIESDIEITRKPMRVDWWDDELNWFSLFDSHSENQRRIFGENWNEISIVDEAINPFSIHSIFPSAACLILISSARINNVLITLLVMKNEEQDNNKYCKRHMAVPADEYEYNILIECVRL